ncbi:MAG: MFS transporter [Acidobacteriota bacterium]
MSVKNGRDTLETAARRARVAQSLGLNRNIAAASAVVFLMGMGEELWKKFLPKYLEALGATAFAVGLFGTAKDFLDAIYQYPGGWIADHLGRRRAFLVFIALACAGYLIYLFSAAWPFLFAGLVFAMAWNSMASPAVFALIGDALPRERRAAGFTIQSLLKRVPMALSPLIGGAMISALGLVAGIRLSLALTIALAAVGVLAAMMINLPLEIGEATNIGGVWRSFHAGLKRLLISDIIIRTCEGMAEVLIVLYVTNISGVSLSRFGALVAAQMATSILVYIPAARVADRVGRKPFVIATFLCFALFPVAVVMAKGYAMLVAAFIIGGLREIGEPSRKAMIVDFARSDLRARSVGLYYLVRSLSITPAAAAGGLLWNINPQVPFLCAGAIGLIGVIVFAATVEERYAS